MTKKPWPTTIISVVRRISDPRDGEAWQRFCDIYVPLMLRHCRRKRIQNADAEDIVQAVLERVARYGLEYDPEVGKFRGWLGKLLRQCIHAHLERAGKQTAMNDGLSELPEQVDAEWASEFNAHILSAAMQMTREQFDDKKWRAFELTWLGQVKPTKAADQLGEKVAWVYRATHHIRKELRRCVLELTDDEPLFLPK